MRHSIGIAAILGVLATSGSLGVEQLQLRKQKAVYEEASKPANPTVEAIVSTVSKVSDLQPQQLRTALYMVDKQGLPMQIEHGIVEQATSVTEHKRERTIIA